MPQTLEASSAEVTLLLTQIRRKGDDAAARLLRIVYTESKQWAVLYMRRKHPDHTLQATALVHEAFIKMSAARREPEFTNRAHFLGVAAQVMRQILSDHPRGPDSRKRGGAAQKVQLDTDLVFARQQNNRLIAVDAALDSLAKLSSRQARIVELRYFTRLSIAEVAEVLDLASRTITHERSGA